MSEASNSDKQAMSEGYSQNSDSNSSYKENTPNSNYRSNKRHYDTYKQKSQNIEVYQEKKGRDNRRHYTAGENDQSAPDSGTQYKKNYNNGNNQRTEGNYNKQYSNGGHQKWQKKQIIYQAITSPDKKKESFSKIEKETIVEKYTEKEAPNQAFMEMIESNTEVFTKTSQRPAVEEKFGLNPDEAVIARMQIGDQRKEKESDILEEMEKARQKMAEWDLEGEDECFKEFGISKLDTKLRKVKSEEVGSGMQARLYNENGRGFGFGAFGPVSKGHQNDPWAINEENGEFSNIDEIFERKLKEKKLQFQEEEEEFDIGEIKKAAERDDEDNEVPVWDEIDAAAIKKETREVENALLGWKSDNEDLKEINGLIGEPEKKFLNDYESFDQNKNADVKNDFYLGSDEEKYGVPNFNMKQLDDSSEEDELFRAILPTSIGRYNSDSTSNRIEPKFTQMQQQQPPIQQLQTPLFQQMPTQHLFQPGQPQLQQQFFNPLMAFNFGQPIGFTQPPTQNLGLVQPTTTTTQPMSLPIGLESRPMIVNVFSQFVSYGFKPDAWFYLDTMKNRQGPFTTKQMNEWYMLNHLPIDLPITSGENTNFMPLNDLINLIFKPSAPVDPLKSSPGGHSSTQQSHSLSSPQQGADLSQNQFQFSQLLDNPLFQQLTDQGSNILPTNIKTAEELELQALNETKGGRHHGKRTRRRSTANATTNNNRKSYPYNNQYQQRNSNPNQMYSMPQHYASPIGMLQPGLALPQDLGHPGQQQTKKKTSLKQNNQGGEQANRQELPVDPTNTADMTNTLKMVLGIGGGMDLSNLGSGSKGQGLGQTYDKAEFPLPSEGSK